MFQKRSGVWFFKGWVSDPSNQAVELTNMGAPEEVWRYFGLERASQTADHLALPEQMPADFGFVAEWGVARMNSLDTFSGTFIKDLVVGSPITAMADLKLTRDEMEKVYQELVAIDILSYPADFAPPYAEVTTPGTEHFVSTVIRYHLRLVVAGIDKDIFWSDGNGSTIGEAVALRDWFRGLIELIVSKAEYKAMPPARGGYA